MALRPFLHPLFMGLKEGVSEFTFANIFLFRKTHSYRLSTVDGLVMISGKDPEGTFFMLPFGLPEEKNLAALFGEFSFMKNATASQANRLSAIGFRVTEDRDNFDYLYSRKDLAELPGRKYHRKKNLVNAFIGSYNYEARPLTEDLRQDALKVLEDWRAGSPEPGDYEAAGEALRLMWPLQLCGGIYYVDGRPAAFTLGEENGAGHFVVHFEKGLRDYKGLMQFVVSSFAAILPERYEIINREQDLGIEGLRKAKMSYRPVAFVRKFRAAAR